MFKRPEELIMAVLAVLWVVFTYFAADYFGAPAETSLLITTLTAIWALVFFLLWQKNRTAWLWPLFLGLLVACWWPFLDWFAIKDIVITGAQADTILIAKPWYASWVFKAIIAVLPVIGGYAVKWKIRRKEPISTIA